MTHDIKPQLPTSVDHILIDDSFECGDAKEIVLALLDSQVQVNKINNLRSQVNQESADSGAQQRMQDLKTSRLDLRALFREAAQAGCKVRLRTTIELHFDEGSTGSSVGRPQAQAV